MPFKKIIRIIHLWLGLISGLLVLFLGITGCVLAFQKEIENSVQSYRYVTPHNKPSLPPSRIEEIAKKQLPGKHLHAVLYETRNKAAQAIFYYPEPLDYQFVYVNQYTGEVLKVKDMRSDFFYQVLMGHYYLWLPPNIGQPIVSYATLVFVIMMISGIILWWPKNRAARKQRFSIKWNAKWRRKNYDLHNVLGFYMSWVAIIIAFTGLIFGLQWFTGAVYKASGGKKDLVYSEPLSDTTKIYSANQSAMDRIWLKMQEEHPKAEIIEVHVPISSSSPIAANANSDAKTFWKTDFRFFDQYTLHELPASSIYGRMANANAADKLIRMNYDIHTGAILGIAGKILAFFASLIAASLPVTGFIIWRGRKKKKKSVAYLQAPSIAPMITKETVM